MFLIDLTRIKNQFYVIRSQVNNSELIHLPENRAKLSTHIQKSDPKSSNKN